MYVVLIHRACRILLRIGSLARIKKRIRVVKKACLNGKRILTVADLNRVLLRVKGGGDIGNSYEISSLLLVVAHSCALLVKTVSQNGSGKLGVTRICKIKSEIRIVLKERLVSHKSKLLAVSPLGIGTFNVVYCIDGISVTPIYICVGNSRSVDTEMPLSHSTVIEHSADRTVIALV